MTDVTNEALFNQGDDEMAFKGNMETEAGHDGEQGNEKEGGDGKGGTNDDGNVGQEDGQEETPHDIENDVGKKGNQKEADDGKGETTDNRNEGQDDGQEGTPDDTEKPKNFRFYYACSYQHATYACKDHGTNQASHSQW